MTLEQRVELLLAKFAQSPKSAPNLAAMIHIELLEVRAEAIEEAAKVADGWAKAWEKHPLDSGRIRVGMSLSIAEDIRALKEAKK